MRIKPCPRCGRMPKIYDCITRKNEIRRRMICCPNLCQVISTSFPHRYDEWFIHLGSEDDYTLFKEWNERVSNS